VILNLAVWFSIHVVFDRVDQLRIGPLRLYVPVWHTVDFVALALSAAALIAMLRFKAGMIPTMGVAAVLGAFAFYAG
jgi:chromate transporter